ncbi:MAG TPA: serine protease [Solirubrobacteraceae bacterium]|jgi:secreted trypsin-like serine protease|nr:serine protease [Solirubrobacteraceae bacterium]
MSGKNVSSGSGDAADEVFVRTSRSSKRWSAVAVAAFAIALTAIFAPLAWGGPGGQPAHASVVGGVPATEGAFPSAAYVLDLNGRVLEQCTGTVVAPSLVLTAGHCAVNMSTGVANGHRGYRVVTGEVEPGKGHGQISNVVGVIPYPGFARHIEAGDAALLVLETPILAPAMPLAKRSQAHLFTGGTRATIAGWGLTSTFQRKLTRRLQFAHTVVQSASWCARHVHPFFPRWELCTVDVPHFASSGCHGDSGGPLMVPGERSGELLEVGVVAFGEARCLPSYPNVFTRVDALAGWLRTWIAAYRSPAVSLAPSAAASSFAATARTWAGTVTSTASSGSLFVQRLARELLPTGSPKLQLEQIAAIVVGRQQREALLDQLALVDGGGAQLGGDQTPSADQRSSPHQRHRGGGPFAPTPTADDLVTDIELPLWIARSGLAGEIAMSGQVDRLGGVVQAGDEAHIAVQLIPR